MDSELVLLLVSLRLPPLAMWRAAMASRTLHQQLEQWVALANPSLWRDVRATLRRWHRVAQAQRLAVERHAARLARPRRRPYARLVRRQHDMEAPILLNL